MILDVLLPNLLPLYILMALGYISGRWMDVNLHSIARLNIYIFLPVVAFGALTRIQFQPIYILLPIVLWVFSNIISLGSCWLAKKVWTDGTANLIGAGGVNGNAIYFGLPLVVAMFGVEGAGLYLFMNLGPSISNTTLAYYLVARGRFSIKDSFIRLIKFPVIYAIIAGLIFNFFGIGLSGIALKYWEYASGCIVILGMMMIGIGVAKLKTFSFDWAFIASLFVVKFIFWPVCIGLLVCFDMFVLKQFDAQIYQILMIFSVMPLIGNLVAYAAEYNLHPEKAAVAVVLSSLATIIIVPLCYWVMSLVGIV